MFKTDCIGIDVTAHAQPITKVRGKIGKVWEACGCGKDARGTAALKSERSQDLGIT